MGCRGVPDGPKEIVDNAVHPDLEHKSQCPPMFEFSSKIEDPGAHQNYLGMFRIIPPTLPICCLGEVGRGGPDVHNLHEM